MKLTPFIDAYASIICFIYSMPIYGGESLYFGKRIPFCQKKHIPFLMLERDYPNDRIRYCKFTPANLAVSRSGHLE